MSRRLHKFFNVNERDETQHHLLDLSQPHVILEKLDGSMITPMVVDNTIRWGTKMGLTGVAEGAEEFVSRHNNYHVFADHLIDQGKTPIFEWCSRKQRIVVDYPSDRLVLIAVRDNVTGAYSSFNDMWAMARDNDIDLVRYYEGTVANMEQLISDTRDLKGVEGWVVRFNDGHMVKIKAEEYVRFHKTKDGLSQEKNVVDMIVNEKIDDAKSFMMDEDRDRVEVFEEQFWAGFNREVDQVNVDLNEIRIDLQGDRKRFALEISPKLDPITRQVMFACWDNGRDVRTELINVIKKNVGTQTKIDGVRHLWGNAKWNYHFDGDA
jgi:RNA ligase